MDVFRLIFSFCGDS